MKGIFRYMATYSKTKIFFSNKDDLVICKSFIEKGVLDEPALGQELGRTPKNILLRWIYHILPSIKNKQNLCSDAFKEELKLKIKQLEENPAQGKKRRYTKEEDEQVLKLAERFGTDWNLISEEMKTRSALSIFHRYTSSLKPGLKNYKVPFTEEEDEIIKKFMETNGKNKANKWSNLSQVGLPDRSPNMLRYRWKILNTDSSPLTLDEYKKFLELLHTIGPDFQRITREGFPKRDPQFLRTFWVHGLQKLVPDFFTFKWTREMDQKLIDCSIAKGFDLNQTIAEDFPKVYDLAEIKYRLTYLFKFIIPNQKSVPYFPFDAEFESKSTVQEISKSLLQRHKVIIPNILINIRKTIFTRKITKPFTKEEDERLVEIIMEVLKLNPLGYFTIPKTTSSIHVQKRIRMEVNQITTWKDIGVKLDRTADDCRNRWNQLKYNLYQ